VTHDELLRTLAALMASGRTTAWLAGPFPSSFMLTVDHARLIHECVSARGINN